MSSDILTLIAVKNIIEKKVSEIREKNCDDNLGKISDEERQSIKKDNGKRKVSLTWSKIKNLKIILDDVDDCVLELRSCIDSTSEKIDEKMCKLEKRYDDAIQAMDDINDECDEIGDDDKENVLSAVMNCVDRINKKRKIS
jgi:hypothetical protein